MLDAVVLGAGGVGSAALYHLSRRGLRVLGIDAFPPAHDRGSSHGKTRIIRQAYFEHPDYVPLLKRAYTLWPLLEEQTGETLFRRTGLVEIGPPNGVVLPGVLESAAQHGLNVDRFSAADSPFPQLPVPENCEGVYEHDAGILLVEDCVTAHLQQAIHAGAEIRHGERVVSWRADDASVTVRTDRVTYHAANLVIAAGAWSSPVLRDLGLPLRVIRKHLHWRTTSNASFDIQNGCPVFFYEIPDGYFYGMPVMDDRGLKVAEHSGGDLVTDPTNINRATDAADIQRIERFLATTLGERGGKPTAHTVCMYTQTPDEHFIVDRHPHHPNVAFAAGLSGHGFKFTGVLGEVLADLVIEGNTTHPIEFLRLNRLRQGERVV